MSGLSDLSDFSCSAKHENHINYSCDVNDGNIVHIFSGKGKFGDIILYYLDEKYNNGERPYCTGLSVFLGFHYIYNYDADVVSLSIEYINPGDDDYKFSIQVIPHEGHEEDAKHKQWKLKIGEILKLVNEWCKKNSKILTIEGVEM